MMIWTWTISGLLGLLGLVHVYWLCGGTRGVAAAIPSQDTTPLFRPGKMATGAVAVGLLLASVFVLELGKREDALWIPERLHVYGGWLLVLLFLLRAIGDGKFMGLFKKQHGTLFAKWDTNLFTPLCLFIGLSILVIMLV
ncbi:DUF3995 domain-containing protein [Marinicrinis sediminis]|uniref:DUF3995 domain-containing protein n=1 Tax=Marinicrinis sediminis TaxID=1652465 RepID=A0ABW5RA11_9BACL